jgi:excisionase family DNA binding protein
MEITFENLPKAVTQLTNDVCEIKRLLLEKSNEAQPEADQLLTIKQAADFLNLKVTTLYTKVHNAELPVCKRSHRLYFSKHDLMEYVKAGRKKTVTELAAEADKYLTDKKKD